MTGQTAHQAPNSVRGKPVLKVEIWVPKAAALKLQEYYSIFSNTRWRRELLGDFIKRLATSPTMESAFKRLARLPGAKPDIVVGVVLGCYFGAAFRGVLRNDAEAAQTFDPFDDKKLADQARAFVLKVKQSKSRDHVFTPVIRTSKLVGELERFAAAKEQRWGHWQAFLKAIPRNRNVSVEIPFTNALVKYLNILTGKPCFEIVADIACAVFDKEDADITSDLVRKRWELHRKTGRLIRK
jgi:hypothetical protein